MAETLDLQPQAGANNVQAQPQPQAGGAPARRGAEERALLPRVDVLEDDGGITLLADLPGVPREQLDIKVEGDTLLIEGSVQPLAPGQLEPLYAEVRVPRYRRAFTLSRELDTGAIQAQLKDGVLTLRLPKQAHAQPRRVEVQLG